MECRLIFEPGGDRPTSGEVEAFLRDRHWYDSRGTRATYVDDDTGVQFQLKWAENGDGTISRFEFRMSYVRPRFFALEAGSELNALVETFDLRVRDPDRSDDESGEFTVEGFLEGWSRGNRSAIESSEADSHHRRAKRSLLVDAWRWNRSRRDYQTVLGEGIFVPSIRLVAEDGEIRRACAWPETIPYVLPAAADLVLLSGLEHRGLAREASELRVVEREPLVELVEAHAEGTERREDPIDHLLIAWGSPPAEVREALPTLGDDADARDFTTVAPDEVLDAEDLE